MDSPLPIAQLDKVTKRFGSLVALNELDLTIAPGVTGLLGPNGAGKSTLIKIMLGLARMTSGTGTLLGTPLGTASRPLRERIGYVPEDDCFIPGLSGVEAVQLAARLSRIPAREALRRSHEMLDFCGMGQERYRKVESYSTGMRQKLKFAAALVHDPELLILDEPTSGLDPDERVAVLRRIRRLADRFSKSIILCTHILPDVEAVSDWVVILSQGIVRLHEQLEKLKQPMEPRIGVSVVGDGDRFFRAATAAGIDIERDEKGNFTLAGDIPRLTSEVWRLAGSTETSIRHLMPARNSLQHVFLMAISEEQTRSPHAHP